jgi:hypothetical protein
LHCLFARERAKLTNENDSFAMENEA